MPLVAQAHADMMLQSCLATRDIPFASSESSSHVYAAPTCSEQYGANAMNQQQPPQFGAFDANPTGMAVQLGANMIQSSIGRYLPFASALWHRFVTMCRTRCF